MPTTPEPMAKQVVCSVCDLPWEDHETTAAKQSLKNPELITCVAVLKKALLRQPPWTQPKVIPSPAWPITREYPHSTPTFRAITEV